MEGEQLGDFVLAERVARGGMAEVWRARGPDGAVVCIKRLDPSLRSDVDFIEMFRDEAALVLDLDHENIVKMYELIDTDDELAQVMEFVDGPSLARIRSAVEEFSIEEALQISIYLARALFHAHTRTRDGIPDGAPLHIVHRDVSPQNILVDKGGHLKLVDFGIAKAAQRLTRTQAGTLKGKLSYMAPEQARGGPLDHRADQFAAGILAWEMLTGRRLFGGRNELLILEQVQKSDPVPPSTVKRSIPRSIDKAVLRALRWHPEERFPDMAAFERALQACLVEVEPRGHFDLAPLVARTLANEPIEKTAAKAQQGAQRTRVISAENDGDNIGSATTSADGAPVMTDPTAQPEHTGQFFRRRAAWSPATLAAGAAGVLVVGAAVSAAVWFAERDTDADTTVKIPPLFTDLAGARAAYPKLSASLAASCRDDCVEPLAKLDPDKLTLVNAADLDACALRCKVSGAGAFQPPAADILEQRLEKAPAHPCRTELLDDLLDKSPLSLVGRAALGDSVGACLLTAADAPRVRASLKPDALEEPGWPRRHHRYVRRTPAVVHAHVHELERRGRLALAVGDYESAKELYAEALHLDASRVADQAPIAQAFRGLGDPANAGWHMRLWLYADPTSPDAERALRYLKRYDQPKALVPSDKPTDEERWARVARLLFDAEHGDPIAPLESARLLAPDDHEILVRLGDAYAKAGRKDDAKKMFQTALRTASRAQARALRARIKKLGSS